MINDSGLLRTTTATDTMGVFLTAVFFMLITPGPGVLSTAGVGSSFGAAAGYRYLTGLFIGTNLVAIAVVSGLAGLVLAQPTLRAILMYASIAYLCYLAMRIALAGSKISFIENAQAPGIRDAVLLQAINPKAYVVNTALFSSFPFNGMAIWQEIAWKFLLVNLVWVPIHLLWLGAGITLQRLDLPAHWHRIINILMALSLLIVVGLAITVS